MRIQLVTPAPRHSLKGNRVTAVRWARILRRLGHRVTLHQELDARPCDLLVALHARRSFASVAKFRELHPERRLVVVLTGTDLYHDLETSTEARKALEWADRLVVLQSEALAELGAALRDKTRVIYQSALRTSARVGKSRRSFDVCVVGHLRPVKDPFRAAAAARRLGPESRLRVLHVGAGLSSEMEARACREMDENPRYRWLGERPQWQVRRLMARSHAMVLSSRLEGGANAASEAVVARLPILATRVPGTIGMLGEAYSGYFNVGATEELAVLLDRCERQPRFLAELTEQVGEVAPRFGLEREQAAWESLIEELA